MSDRLSHPTFCKTRNGDSDVLTLLSLSGVAATCNSNRSSVSMRANSSPFSSKPRNRTRHKNHDLVLMLQSVELPDGQPAGGVGSGGLWQSAFWPSVKPPMRMDIPHWPPTERQPVAALGGLRAFPRHPQASLDTARGQEGLRLSCSQL